MRTYQAITRRIMWPSDHNQDTVIRAGRGCSGRPSHESRRLIESACYDAEQLKALQKAFDDAWEQIAPEVSNRPGAIEAARLKLAQVVLGLAKNGTALDPQQLADAAVQLMQIPPRKLRP